MQLLKKKKKSRFLAQLVHAFEVFTFSYFVIYVLFALLQS